MEITNIYLLVSKNLIIFIDKNKIYFEENDPEFTLILKNYKSYNLANFYDIKLNYIEISNNNVSSFIKDKDIFVLSIDEMIVFLGDHLNKIPIDNKNLISYIGLLLLITSYQHKELKNISSTINKLHRNLKNGGK